MNKESSGSALVMLLLFMALLSLLCFFLTQTLSLEKRTTLSLASSYEASEAAESGLNAALSQLSAATSNHPGFLVGETNLTSSDVPVLMIGTTNLTNSEQLTLLISGSDFSNSVDVNKNHSIAVQGTYDGPWTVMTNAEDHPVARYAYIMLDEQARLNPSLHQGFPRTDPIDWDQGVRVLPLTLSNALLLTSEEITKAFISSPITLEGWERIFYHHEFYDAKKIFLTTAAIALPDLIPASLPEGGKPKYNLNELATNSLYGATPSDRAVNIATIIDRNFPHFKERDPSLLGLPAAEQRRYLNRLAACIVDYISTETAPTLVNGGEPAGQSLTPLLTQTAERCRLLLRTSNSVTIENQYFVQVWNPYTKPIPAGGVATLSIQNRQRLLFEKAPPTPFEDYMQQGMMISPLRPNESAVITFPAVTQTWASSTNVPLHLHPHWEKGPEGNADVTRHQTFTFSWNGALVTMSRRPPIGPGLAQGGLEHDAASLSDFFNYWQCNFIPTEEDHAGHFRFVGDPRETYLSNYLWKSYSSAKSYVENTRWKGIMSDATPERLFSPTTTWIRRDFVPLNPPSGNKPSSLAMTPDQVPSPYNEARDAALAPLVLRKGAMNSIVELGNVNDPAQADDLGVAPLAGSSDDKSSVYASGGGRTLRIGQPEFSYWDTPEKRAINLLDLFTVSSTNNSSVTVIPRSPGQGNTSSVRPLGELAAGDAVPEASGAQRWSVQSVLDRASTGATPQYASAVELSKRSTTWRKGLININTAPHEVLTALFYGITPTSDTRFTNSTITAATAEELATFLEEHRPYEKLSDLYIITPFLANATTYTPSLSVNVPGENAAAVFDRAREEGFAKMISLCTVQSRAFRVYVIGQSLNAAGKPLGEALLEASVVLLPEKKESALEASSHEVGETEGGSLLVPVVQKREWLR